MGNLGGTINFAAGDYQVMVGSLDVTPLVAQFSLSRPLPDVGTPYAWSGSVTLVEGLNANTIAESLNDLINPVRWAKGIYPVTVSIDGFKVATLRVLEYFYEDDPGPDETPTAEMQLGDLLVLNDYKTPPKDYKGLGFGLGSVSVNAIAAKVFSELNLTGVVDVPGSIDVAPDKPDGSWIQWLQGYLGERGYWLYVDPDEIIRVAAYPLNYNSSGYLANFARRQVENYKRNRSAVEIPVEKQLVTATCEKRLPQGSSGQLQTLIEYAQIGNRLSISRVQSNRVLASTPTRKVEEIIIEQAKGIIAPELFPGDTGLIQTSYTRETTIANTQGKVYKKESPTSMLLMLALPDLYGGKREGLAMVENAEIVIEEWRSSSPRVSSSDTSVVRYHLITTYKTLPVGSNAYKVDVAAQVSEEWSEEVAILGGDESTPKCERFRYERIEQKRSVSETTESAPGGTNQPFFTLGALAITNQERKNDQSPPAWDTLAPAQDSSAVTLKGVAKFAPVGYTPYAETEDEYQANTLQSVGECNRLAQLLGTLKHHAYKSRDINTPPPAAWLANPAPFHTAAIHDGVYVLCADSLGLSEEELEIAWTGHYVGAIPTILEPDTVPTFAPVPVFTEPVSIVSSLEGLTDVVTPYDRFDNYLSETIVSSLEGLTDVVAIAVIQSATVVSTMDSLTDVVTDGGNAIQSVVSVMDSLTDVVSDGGDAIQAVVSTMDSLTDVVTAADVTVVGDAAYVAAQMPNVPIAQRQSVADAALTAASAIGGGTTQYQVIDTIVARTYNWLVFRPGATFQDNAGTIAAVAGDPVGRANPWIGSIHAYSLTNDRRPILTASNGASFDGLNDYLISSTASFALPATFSVARKTNALFGANDYPGVFVMRTGSIVKPGIAASNENILLTGVGLQGGGNIPTATNKVTWDSATVGAINGASVSASDLGAFNVGVELPYPTGFNIVYGGKPSSVGSKTAAIGADSFDTSGFNRYWFGEIGDLIWLNALLSTNERAIFTAFLKAFWSIV